MIIQAMFASLKSFTNCIIFIPVDPNAGPTGGAVVAFPSFYL